MFLFFVFCFVYVNEQLKLQISLRVTVLFFCCFCVFRFGIFLKKTGPSHTAAIGINTFNINTILFSLTIFEGIAPATVAKSSPLIMV